MYNKFCLTQTINYTVVQFLSILALGLYFLGYFQDCGSSHHKLNKFYMFFSPIYIHIMTLGLCTRNFVNLRP